MKKLLSMIILSLLALAVTACTGGATATKPNSLQKNGKNDAFKLVFYPNESAQEFEKSREALKEIVAKATGKKVEVVTTTDYNVVIETIANGQANMAVMGAEGYIQAHKKNPKVQPIVTNSGPSGTLEDALYYSFIAVPEDKKIEYQQADKYTLEPIKGKNFSFVSNSSTSGFKVPSSVIIDEFGLDNSDELIMENKFFNKVLFGGSHQGSAVNLLKGDVDAAAFMNMPEYFEVASGEENQTGMVYKVRETAGAPFESVRGKKVRVIKSIPVLNAPIVVNEDVVSQDEKAKILAAFTSDETSQNKAIFNKKDGDNPALFGKEKDEQFVEVEDAFYEPIRQMSE